MENKSIDIIKNVYAIYEEKENISILKISHPREHP